ncbi:glycosyltransferase family protein [Oleidesulfovibrio alaskensis]
MTVRRTTSFRPPRITVRNWNGTTQTLPDGGQSYETLTGTKNVLVLGLGPFPAQAAALADALARRQTSATGGHDSGGYVSYVECADFASQMPASWHEAIPRHWQNSTPDAPPPYDDTGCGSDDSAPAAESDRLAQLVRNHVRQGGSIVAYRQNARLFPGYWGKALAAARLEHMRRASSTSARCEKDTVLLAGSRSDLLVLELHHALTGAGLQVQCISPDDGHALPAALRHCSPALFLCVNFKGLDTWGERFNLLDAAGVPVAVWCVDNPWHLVSGIRSPFWKQVRLFVTDSSFCRPLQEHGARHVQHLPLATMAELFDPAREQAAQLPPAKSCGALPDGLEHMLIFAGRSAFPDRERFFAGCRYPHAAMQQADEMLRHGERPDFDWWCATLRTSPLWPSHEVRSAGLAAEECARRWRTACLTACAAIPGSALTVFGDDGWQSLLPQGTAVHPPVDYYTVLPHLYARAAATLNLTSMLLPAGLTQRNFDVWAAGGFCLTDNTPGLEIFPRELVCESSFRTAGEIPELFGRVMHDHAWRRQVARAWHSHILARHTYHHRIAALLEACGCR